MKILFFDILISGHHTEYINHLVEYLIVHSDGKNYYYFVVHQNFNENFGFISAKAQGKSNIKFIEVDECLLIDLQVKNRFKRSVNNLKVVLHYTELLSIDICYLLHFNVFQIALGLRKTNFKVRGILFMQFTNMKIKSFKDYYYYLRRLLPLKLCMFNRNIESIFLLNDQESCKRLNKKFKKKDVFRYLPDPVSKNIIDPSYSINHDYSIATNRKILLHFGSLSYRKGIIEILDGLLLLSKSDQQKLTLLIAGKVAENGLKKDLEQRIQQHKSLSHVQIIWENTFVSEAKMNNLFNACDYVLMTYKNPEASSGILGHAMKANKPVIGPSAGLVGKIIASYELGYTLKEISPDNIALALKSLKKLTFNYVLVKKFLDEHTPKKFAEILLWSQE